jgi:cell division protein FtsN
MRDYNQPRQSYTTSSHPRVTERHESPKTPVGTFLIVAGVVFFVGFCTGWYFSQQSAKKAYRAALEQKSLENTPNEVKPVQPAVAPQAQTNSGTTPQGASAPAAGAPNAPSSGPPLTFYNNLPNGQKNTTVLGSGINEKPKPAPPAPATPKQPADPQKPATAAPAAKGAEGFLVQVASFSSRQEAESAKAKLAGKGYSATLSEINLNDKGTWYRVRVGRHLDKEAATDIAAKLGKGAIVQPDRE